ncbi:MAG TPA: hypothetical protein VEC11_05385 [Allosphingosinicella sp.]|nr:hypothetical protein [Allosphingosinicella sp.]
MKTISSVALVVTCIAAFPVSAGAMGRPEASPERRHCTQLSAARAASRLPPRRMCRTPAQWTELLGPEWRRRLEANDIQADIEAMQSRMTPDDAAHGPAPWRSYGRAKQD